MLTAITTALNPFAADSLYLVGAAFNGSVDAPGDDESADTLLAAMQSALDAAAPGAVVKWAGSGNTDGSGYSTEDICVTWGEG